MSTEQPYPMMYTTPFILYPPSLWENKLGDEFAHQYLALEEDGKDFVMYVSVPFCRVRCHSCPYFIDLLSVNDQQGKEAQYIDALVKDLQRWASYRRFKTGQLRSVYIGGGTGSILATENIKRIVDTIFEYFPVAEDCSITLEGNARDYTPEKFDYVVNSQINRVSLGVQSFNEQMLRVIGSPHAAEQSIYAIKEFQKRGFDNIQMDMMYNLPGHTRDIWQSDLEKMRELGVKHFTIYLYRIHEDTPQANFIQIGKIPPPVDKQSSYVKRMYLDAIRVAEDMGFRMYMFDHFAVPGYENIYNEWTFRRDHNVEVLGVGPGAYGFINNYRVGAKKDIREYVATVNRGHHMITSVSEQLSPRMLRERYIINTFQYLSVDLKQYEAKFGSSLLEDFQQVVVKLLKKNLVIIEDDHLKMTDLGKEWRMNIMLEFTHEMFWNDARGREQPNWSMNIPMVDLFAGQRETWLGPLEEEEPTLAV